MVLQHLNKIKKKHNINFFPEKIVTSLANIFTMEKLVVISFLGVKDLFVNRFSFLWPFLRLLDSKRMIRALFFLEVFQSNFGMTC